MQFTSTRDGSVSMGFSDAILSGYARGQGVWQPSEEADLRQFFLLMDGTASYREVALMLAASFADPGFSSRELDAALAPAFAFEPALRPVAEGVDLLELYRGPTGSFRDYGASFLAYYLGALLSRKGRKARLLASSRGDSGCALAKAFAAAGGAEVVILYPRDAVVRGIEPESLASGKVRVLRVDGSFEDCQAMIRDALQDRALSERLSLGAASSVNIGRLVPQAFYFAWTFAREKGHAGSLYFALPPSGAGNLIAGIYAWKWGMPTGGFVAAARGKDFVLRCLEGRCGWDCAGAAPDPEEAAYGDYENGERLDALMAGAPGVMRAMLRPAIVTAPEEDAAIARTYRERGIFLSPDAAATLVAAERAGAELLAEGGRIVALGTGHPAKHAARLRAACGVAPEVPEELAFLGVPVEGSEGIGAGKKALADWLEGTARG